MVVSGSCLIYLEFEPPLLCLTLYGRSKHIEKHINPPHRTRENPKQEMSVRVEELVLVEIHVVQT
jgi:hypothetical protein